MKIFAKIENSYQKKQPFVVYRKPESTDIAGFFQKNDLLNVLNDFSESGFVFAPFDSSKKTIFFPENDTDFISEKLHFDYLKNKENVFEENSIQRENHLKVVQNAINEIANGTFKKVVISRNEVIKLNDFNLVEVYQKLLQNYPTAFVYIWFHPKVGLWLGATPETLLKIENLDFETMSLAGTQTANNLDNVVWQQKELIEQGLVTDFIQNQLKNLAWNLKISPIETIKAGNLFHLRTKVSGKLNTENSVLKDLIEALHPTPAVCGLPRNESKKYILENENYDREFYTGFLGELNLKNTNSDVKKSMLYVNLRCMKITKMTANLFIGGGIIKDSNPEKEWQETVSKSKTMKLVL